MNYNGRDGNRRNDDANDDDEGANAVAAGVTVLAGMAAVAGGIYWLSRSSDPAETTQQTRASSLPQAREAHWTRGGGLSLAQPAPAPSAAPRPAPDFNNFVTDLAELITTISTPSRNSDSDDSESGDNGVVQFESCRRNPPPPAPVLSNLSALLADIYVRFVQLKHEDFQLHYRVFDSVFRHLHQKMKDVDPYYRKYSSTIQFAGSHFDNLRINKPDEFDMDIVIDLPLNLNAHPTNPADSDIFIEPKTAGFAQLKMGVQFQKLPMRDGLEWLNNRAAYEWMDNTKYLLRSKFLDWFKSVVDRALNTLSFLESKPVFFVDGVPYLIRKSGSGPAVTLIIENENNDFKLDVDLVPALRFPESRWPIGPAYRRIPARCARGYWMLVGKPIKNGIPHDQSRSWRVALHNQERELMHDLGNLKITLKLIKKVRDSLGMKKIASYYIKTLFFWEIVEQDDPSFWLRSSPAFLFKHMVEKLHAALVARKIPYFWNKGNNLIGGVEDSVLREYAAKLWPLVLVLKTPQQYKQVARYLLTADEFREYNDRFLHI